MSYTTQMDATRKAIITKELKKVATYENMDVKELLNLVGEGKKIQNRIQTRK